MAAADTAPPASHKQVPWLVGAAFLVGLALPALALDDPTLADSMSLRIKYRSLSLPELFHPDQVRTANPYYRPLYVLFQGWTDVLSGASDLGLRLLALGCHAFAAGAVFLLARVLGFSRSLAAAAVLLFLLVPGNVFTAAWPVVAYWTLAAALAFAAVAALVRYQEQGRLRHLLGALALAALSLLSSQTAYQFVALCPVLAVCPPLRAARRGARRRALLAWPLVGALALAHFAFLENSARGLASAGPWSVVQAALRSYVPYWREVLGGDAFAGDARLPLCMLLFLALALVRADRLTVFLLLFAATAPFPFAAIGHSERYGYYASGALCLLVTRAFLVELRGALPGAAGAGRLAGGLAWGCLVLALAWQSVQRLDLVRQAARRTGTLVADLEELAPRIPVESTLFLNLPPSLKWPLNDILGADSQEQLVQPRILPVFCTDTAYFAAAPLEPRTLSPPCTHVVECTGEHLVERSLDQPLGAREWLPLWFLAGGYEVHRRPPGAGGLRGQAAWREELLSRFRKQGDPLSRVIVEQALPGLETPLPTGAATFRFEPGAPATGSSGTAAPPGQLVADLDLPRAGLLVVMTYFAAEDPLYEITGAVGRFCRHVEATLDGSPVTIVPVYFHAAGIVVPPGQHQVVVRQKLRSGSAVSLPEEGLEPR